MEPTREEPHPRLPMEHISDWEARVVEAKYSPRQLCAQCGFSMRHVERFMMKRFKVSLRDFVAAVRMAKAYNLLKAGFTIKETALGLGFKQVSHFCRCFRQRYKTKPSAVIMNLTSRGKGDGATDPQLELEFIRAQPKAANRKASKANESPPENPAKKRKKNSPGKNGV